MKLEKKSFADSIFYKDFWHLNSEKLLSTKIFFIFFLSSITLVIEAFVNLYIFNGRNPAKGLRISLILYNMSIYGRAFIFYGTEFPKIFRKMYISPFTSLLNRKSL